MKSRNNLVPLVPRQIGFRLDEQAAQNLYEEALKYGYSPHELARQIVTDFLADGERQRLRADFSALKEQVLQMREDLKEAVIAVLCDAGKIENPSLARQWVSEKFFKS